MDVALNNLLATLHQFSKTMAELQSTCSHLQQNSEHRLKEKTEESSNSTVWHGRSTLALQLAIAGTTAAASIKPDFETTCKVAAQIFGGLSSADDAWTRANATKSDAARFSLQTAIQEAKTNQSTYHQETYTIKQLIQGILQKGS
jgi:hypothetical protein